LQETVLPFSGFETSVVVKAVLE
jgi:hypothetical protein